VALVLEGFAARLPELGIAPTSGFLLLQIAGRSDPATDGVPYRDAGAAPREPTRNPLCLAFAIDASSSMRGTRFALALQAARDLVDSLRSDDRLAIVTFSRGARVMLGPVTMDDTGKLEARGLLDRLSTSQGTNLSAGWREAADAISRILVPGAVRRVLMLTDGAPSAGEVNEDALEKMVADGRQQGIETSVIGLGEGISETLCSRLARGGDGRFHYVRDEGLIGDLVAHEIEGARGLAAEEVAVVIAFTARVVRAEVMHRYVCRPEGRAMEVRVGSVAFDVPRFVLAQFELDAPSDEAVLGAAVARGRRVGGSAPRFGGPTAEGFALGAAPRSEGSSDDADVTSERLSISLGAGSGSEDARKRVAWHVLTLRTLAEIKSAWDAFDEQDTEAIGRRLGRARELRRKLLDARLVTAEQLADIPDVDVVAAALSSNASNRGEARRTFTAWSHNTMVSQLVSIKKKPEGDEE